MLRTFTCERCGKPFDKAWFPSRDLPKYCSHSCRMNRKTIKCHICQKPFETFASRDSKYCSKPCKFIGTRRKPRACLFCGKDFTNTNDKYCTYECSVSHRQSLVTKNFCEYCGKLINPQRSMRYRKYCSKECSSKNQVKTGIHAKENNYNWRGGRIEYRGPNWIRQADLARKRDDNTCQMCGKHSIKPKLPVHHIKPFRDFGTENYKLANELDNLITLCIRCHTKTESQSPYHFPIASYSLSHSPQVHVDSAVCL